MMPKKKELSDKPRMRFVYLRNPITGEVKLLQLRTASFHRYLRYGWQQTNLTEFRRWQMLQQKGGNNA